MAQDENKKTHQEDMLLVFKTLLAKMKNVRKTQIRVKILKQRAEKEKVMTSFYL